MYSPPRQVTVMFDLLNKINLDENLKKKVIDLVQADRVNLLMLAQKCNDGNFDCLKSKKDLTRLAVVLLCADKMYSRYADIGIDDKIFFDTIDDLRIWCENNGNKGLKNYRWLKNHLSCELFKIGRLQYQMYTCENKSLKYDLLPFDFGEKVIYIHIPQGERLVYSDCVESIKMAKKFFADYFPEYEYRFFFCESWLIYGENWRFMERSSNILQFSTLFDVAYSVDDDSQAIERIFGKRKINRKKYSEATSLQRRAKAHLQSKGSLGIGIGVIEKDLT